MSTGAQNNTASATASAAAGAAAGGTGDGTAGAATTTTTDQTLLGGALAGAEGSKATTVAEVEAERKAAEDKAAADKAAADKAKSGPPEEYAEFTLPEGIVAAPEQLTAFKGLAKELGLTQENAQKLVSFQAEAQKAQAAALEAQRKTWRDTIQKDPRSTETLMFARRAVDKLADVEARELLTSSWLGDHPAIIRMLEKAGRMLSEHTTDPGAAGTTRGAGQKDVASILFGK